MNRSALVAVINRNCRHHSDFIAATTEHLSDKRASTGLAISSGYADGFPRSISNRDGAVLVGGRRCPLLGRITMDLMMVDVTAVPGVQLGDEVVLIGEQGGEEIFVAEVAERSGTIAWEIFTGITPYCLNICF